MTLFPQADIEPPPWRVAQLASNIQRALHRARDRDGPRRPAGVWGASAGEALVDGEHPPRPPQHPTTSPPPAPPPPGVWRALDEQRSPLIDEPRD